MKLSIYLHGSSPFNPKVTIDEYSRLAKYYESIGVDTLWFADHLIRTPDILEQPIYETWSLISALAMVTKKIRFGTLVTPITYRNLGLFAKIVSTADHISNGRITVGLGNGWFDKEHKMFGLDFPETKIRNRLLKTYITGLLGLWTKEEKITINNSDGIELNSAYLNPKPIQKPHPPILIGGGGEKITLNYVAKYAQMSNFSGDIDRLTHKLSVLESHCNRLGRNFTEIITTSNMAVIIGKDDREVEESVTNYRNRFVELGMKVPSLDGFRSNRLIGTIEEISEQLDLIKDIGIKMINMTVNDKMTEGYLVDLFTSYA